MPAITQDTGSQVPLDVQNVQEADNADWEDYSYEKKPDIVLTGFGRFGNITINPSFQIAQALPPSLKAIDGSSISLARHPEAVHVGWESVLKFIPELYNTHITAPSESNATPEIPFFIHIGAGYPGRYHLETVAHRDGYWKSDVDGKAPSTRAKCKGMGYPCEGEKDPLSPTTLQTGIDVDNVVNDVKKELPGLTMPVAASPDAGNYLCDFIFYTSLREARLRCGNIGLNKVLFVHVPPNGTVDEGVKVLSAVIRSIMHREKNRTGRMT